MPRLTSGALLPLAWIVLVAGLCAGNGSDFIRGDCNFDQKVDLSDAVTQLAYVLSGIGSPPCLDACDVDDSGSLSIADGIYLLNYLTILGSPPPPFPFAVAGSDPTLPSLGCDLVPGPGPSPGPGPGPGPGSTDLFPYYSRSDGALDYMGVSITRTVPTQSVWAPGSTEQPYPGGWVTPGTYSIAINQPRIHHQDAGNLTGQLRSGHGLLGRVVHKDLLDPGWTNHAFDVPADVTPEFWGASETVDLVVGDVLHVAYGNPIVPWQKRNGSDGIVIYCVADAPAYRGGLWGTAGATSPPFDQAMWELLSERITAAAQLEAILTSGFYYGPSDGTLPATFPSDFAMNPGDPTDNRQGQRIARYIGNRATALLQQGNSWGGSVEDLDRLFRFYCNNIQTCFAWGDGPAQHYFYAHGPEYYPPYFIDQLLMVIKGAVALGYDPTFEPFQRLLTHMAQRVDMSLPPTGCYTYNNNPVSGGLAAHIGDNVFTQWLWNTGATDMGARGSHRIKVWAPCFWARRLLQWPDTLATADMLGYSGWGPGQDRHGHEYTAAGHPAGYEAFYSGLEIQGSMWLWFTGTAADSQHSRYARRCLLYALPQSEMPVAYDGYYVLWTKANFVEEVTGGSVTPVSGGASLTWSASADPDLSHYRVYRGNDWTDQILVADLVSPTSYFDSAPAGSWMYTITAVDSDGNESVKSDALDVTVP